MALLDFLQSSDLTSLRTLHKSQLLSFVLESLDSECAKDTAILNCHLPKLHSVILNRKPKIRLFVAEKGCELFNEFDKMSPPIPIHPHKHRDIFISVRGFVVNHIYQESQHGGLVGKYCFSRLDGEMREPEYLGKTSIKYIASFVDGVLESDCLHTVSCLADKGVCSWLIVEEGVDKNFNPVLYSKEKPKAYSGLYVKGEISYLKMLLRGES